MINILDGIANVKYDRFPCDLADEHGMLALSIRQPYAELIPAGLIDAADGKLIVSAGEASIDITDLAVFSKDGTKILTCGWRTAHILDSATLKQIVAAQVLGSDSIGHVLSIAFSSNSRRFVTGAGGFLEVWDSETGKPLTPERPKATVPGGARRAGSADQDVAG